MSATAQLLQPAAYEVQNRDISVVSFGGTVPVVTPVTVTWHVRNSPPVVGSSSSQLSSGEVTLRDASHHSLSANGELVSAGADLMGGEISSWLVIALTTQDRWGRRELWALKFKLCFAALG